MTLCKCGCGEQVVVKTSMWRPGHHHRASDANRHEMQKRIVKHEQGLCIYCDDCPVPYGTCHCGCGRTTNIAPRATYESMTPKGAPRKFIVGHASRQLSDETVRAMRQRYAEDDTLTQYDLAEEFGISQPAVSWILRLKRRGEAGV